MYGSFSKELKSVLYEGGYVASIGDAWCYNTDNTTTARIQINSFREMFFVVF